MTPDQAQTTAGAAKPAVLPDPVYEFSAPRYYDFASNSQELPSTERADAWFDTAGTSALTSPPAKVTEKPHAQQVNATKLAGDGSAEAVSMDIDNQENRQFAGNAAAAQPPSNIVTSWGPAKTNKRKQPDAPTVAGCPQDAGGKPGQQAESRNAPNAHKQSTGMKAEKAARVEIKKAAVASSPTSVSSPKLTTARTRAGAQAKTTEELQLEKAQKEKQALQEGRQRPVATGKHTCAGSHKPLTEPEDVELHTAKRQRTQGASTHAKAVEPKTEWKSTAQQVAAFPMRSQSKAHETRQPASSPKAPQFATDSRLRGTQAKSHDELEAEAMANMPRFKARNVNADVLLGVGQMQMPRAEARPLTEARSPDLATKQRAAQQLQPSAEVHQTGQGFKAQPFDRKILDAPAFEPKRGEHVVTQAKSPQLATKSRARPEEAAAPASNAPFVFNAKPAASGAEPRVTRNQKRKGQHRAAPGPTTAQPFNFSTDTRGEARRAALQASQAEKEKAERAGHQYKANPLPPHLHHPDLPALPEPSFTVPEPFQLPGDALHQQAEAAKQQYLEEEELKRKAQAAFKAQPIKTGHAVAIQPSSACLTVPDAPCLALDQRTLSRQAFDAAVAQKKKQAEAEEAALKEAKRLAEEEEIREHRKNLQFKAKPVPTYGAPFLPALSGSKLTEAKSPAFCTRSRDK